MKREIFNRALKGDKFSDLHIIDCHCHMGPWYNFYFPGGDIDNMLEDADISGVEKLYIAPHASISCDFKLGNAKACEAAKKHPGRVFAMLTINGSRPEETAGEFDKYYNNPAFMGIKVHPSLHKYKVSDENYYAAYAIIRRRGGYILTHSWEGCAYSSVELCEEAIKAFPGVPFILAHAGGLAAGVDKSIRLVNKYENAYIDTSGFEFSDTWIEEIMDRVDRLKIFFGSDMPFHDQRGGLSRILLADIDDSDKENILGNNFRKMLLFNPKK
jgi:uncharacterized protein